MRQQPSARSRPAMTNSDKFTARATREFLTWVDRFCKRERCSRSDLFALALGIAAEVRGFAPPPSRK